MAAALPRRSLRPAPHAARAFAALTLALVWVADASSAYACACCDGGSRAVVLGFSNRGRVLIEQEGIAGCGTFDMHEIWRLGAQEPESCFDLYAEDPDVPVSCEFSDRANPEPDRRAAPGDSPRRRREFPHAPGYLPADAIRATLVPFVGTVSDSADGTATHTLRVAVRTTRGFAPVLSMNLALGEPDTEGGPASGLQPVVVLVAVAANARHVVVLVSGHDTMPGIGHFPTDVRTAPVSGLVTRGLLGQGRPVTATPAHSARPVGDLTEDPVSDETVRSWNSYAFESHRRGDYAEARAMWRQLLLVAPGDAIVRYNLACAEARLGHANAALALLRDLRTQADAGCTTCQARIERARRDPDLASLRRRRSFREIVAQPPEP